MMRQVEAAHRPDGLFKQLLEQVAKMSRGFATIGLVRPKDPHNVGAVLRAAHVYGASLVAIEGDRSRIRSVQDTTKAWRHMPVVRGDDLFDMIPYASVPIAVDLIEGAIPLPEFKHPESAFYIFGPEDGTLGRKHADRCKYVVSIPTRFCMNLAATVNVVLYDRLAKQTPSARMKSEAVEDPASDAVEFTR